MLSPYHRAKETRPFDFPEVRTELLFAQRLLNQLRLAEHTNKSSAALHLLERFTQFVKSAFKETLHDCAPDIHSACDWMANREPSSTHLLRATLIFTSAVINHREVSVALPLLKKLQHLTRNDRTLKSICSMNSAIALTNYAPDQSLEHWENAVQELPLSAWKDYPAIALGCEKLLGHSRARYEEHGEQLGLLAAGACADRAFAALTHKDVKGTPFECSVPAVALMISVGTFQRATRLAGLTPLEIPEATEILKLAVINAAANTDSPPLFSQALTFLAHHYMLIGDKEQAKDTACQALVEHLGLSLRDPKVLRLLSLIIGSAK